MKRAVWNIAVAAVSAALLYTAWVWIQVERQAVRDEARSADIILVLGAAEYRGHPSPVLKARLDHALELYQRKLAPSILTTGGAGGDPVFTEGGVSRDYLIQHGVPAEAIVAETEGSSTVASTILALEKMRRMALRSAIVVSDGYHIYRVKKMLEAGGLKAYGSPRRELGHDTLRERWNCFRQAVGYVLWTCGLTI